MENISKKDATMALNALHAMINKISDIPATIEVDNIRNLINEKIEVLSEIENKL